MLHSAALCHRLSDRSHRLLALPAALTPATAAIAGVTPAAR